MIYSKYLQPLLENKEPPTHEEINEATELAYKSFENFEMQKQLYHRMAVIAIARGAFEALLNNIWPKLTDKERGYLDTIIIKRLLKIEDLIRLCLIFIRLFRRGKKLINCSKRIW